MTTSTTTTSERHVEFRDILVCIRLPYVICPDRVNRFVCLATSCRLGFETTPTPIYKDAELFDQVLHRSVASTRTDRKKDRRDQRDNFFDFRLVVVVCAFRGCLCLFRVCISTTGAPLSIRPFLTVSTLAVISDQFRNRIGSTFRDIPNTHNQLQIQRCGTSKFSQLSLEQFRVVINIITVALCRC